MSVQINSLLIKPTGPDCNIACRYCFYYEKKELFKGNIHRMSEKTAGNVLKQYFEYAGQTSSIGFQGGEPTLCGLDFFTRITELIKEYKKPYQQCLVSLQTNGILLDENWAEFFINNNVLVGLSMDGPPEIHDYHRLDRSKKGSHDKVYKNMQMLKRMGVQFNTLSVITKANANRGKDLIEYFKKHASGYMQFIPCVEVIDGKIADYTPSPQEYSNFLIEVFDLWFNNGEPEFYVRLFDEMLISFVEYLSPSCYFSPKCAANLVVEFDGSIYPCDFFVENDWKLGNINDTPFSEIVNNPKLYEFINRKSILDDKCGSCKWKSICQGDCPKYRLSAEGKNINSAYFCEGYKEFFEYAAPKLMQIKKRLHSEKNHPRGNYWQQLEKSLERNSLCPCGSGMKYKKCCQGIKGV